MSTGRGRIKSILLDIMKLIKMKKGRKGEGKGGDYIKQNLLLSLIQ